MATRRTTQTRPDTKVPINVVKKLQESPGGINPVIDKLRSDFLLTVAYAVNSMTIAGDIQDIVDMAIEWLELQVRSNTSSKPTSNNKTLGTGTVIWTYTEPHVLNLQQLFSDELASLGGMDKVKIQHQTCPICTVIECHQSVYERVNEIINKMDKALKNIQYKTVNILPPQTAAAMQFERESHKVFYGIVRKNTTPNAKCEQQLYLYSRTTAHQDEAVSTWTEKAKHPPAVATQIDVAKSQQTKPHKPATTEDPPTVPPPTDDTPASSTVTKTTEKPTVTVKPKETTKRDQVTTWTMSAHEQTVPKHTQVVHSSKKYKFEMNNMRVLVYKASITDIDGLDAITNAANEQLAHIGGLALHISKAAGKTMDDECKMFVEKNGALGVGKCYASTPGHLSCKGIIHTVGPIWRDYQGRQDQCARDLHDAIVNVLECAAREGWGKIALSAISSGIFGVPQQLCAEMYILAMSDFARRGSGSVVEIHFVDLSDDILNLVQNAHKLWLQDPSRITFDNANKYPAAVSFAGSMSAGRQQGATGSNVNVRRDTPAVQLLRQSRTKHGQTKYMYSVMGRVTVCLYKGSITDAETQFDAIVCAYGGRLAQVIQKEVGKDYYMRCLQQVYKEVHEGDVFHIDGRGRLKGSIIHVCYDKARYNLSSSSLQDLAQLNRNLLTYTSRVVNASIVAMPLLTPARTEDCHSSLQKVACCFIEQLLQLCRSSPDLTLQEIHMADVNSYIVEAINDEFSRWTNPHYVTGKSSYSDDKTPGNREQRHLPHRPGIQNAFCDAPRDADARGNVRQAERGDGRRGMHQRPNADTTGTGWQTHTPLPENHTSAISPVTAELQNVRIKNDNLMCGVCPSTAVWKLDCSHIYCDSCLQETEENWVCKQCHEGGVDSTANTRTHIHEVDGIAGSSTKMAYEDIAGSGRQRGGVDAVVRTGTQSICPICLWEVEDGRALPCGHKMCSGCYQRFEREAKPMCPVCVKPFGKITGNQPPAQMFYRSTAATLPGFLGCGAIEIMYSVNNGIQSKEHPSPGKPYKGIQRTAYLPDNTEGRHVLQLLRRAFDRRLIFTIGESRTTGKEAVTWNDIHHKTSPSGGPAKFGYPDETYLQRVQEELAAKGITD